tara:strand:- start:13819 stop:14160 length:342 start_codon:yes stop_codon:yes gene_type:complete
MSVHLTVSGVNVDGECAKVVRALKNHGASLALVKPAKSLEDGRVFSACTVTLPYDDYGMGDKKEPLANLWSAIRSPLGLDCAFLNIEGRFSGCIKNYLRPSACGFQNDSKQAT